MKSFIPLLVALLVIPAMIYQELTPPVQLTDAPIIHLTEIPGYESVELEPSEAESTLLPKDTILEKRRYQAPDGSWFQVSIVIGGTSKSSIHRPELCLPAQGFQMMKPRTVTVNNRDWRLITAEAKGGACIGFAYTFFNQAGFQTASHTHRIWRDIWDRSILNRIDRWVMMTVNASATDDASLITVIEKLKGILND